MAERDEFQSTAGQAVHKAAEKASELAHEVGTQFEEAGTQFEEAAHYLREEAAGLPQYVDAAARDLRSMLRQTEDLARRRPELVLAGSVLGGLALARVFNSSAARCAIGIGVGWLLVRHARSGGAGLYEGMPADADGLMDPYSAGEGRGRVSRITNAVKDQASRAVETVKERAERVRHRTREKVQRAGAAARTVVESAEEAASKAGASRPGSDVG